VPGDVAPWDLRFSADDPADLEPLGGGRFRVRVHAEPGLGDGRAVITTRGEVVGYPLGPVHAGRYVQWSATVGPLAEPAGLSFAFRVEGSGQPVYLVPAGTTAAVERLDRWWIDPSAPSIDTPHWVRGAVIYQVFPERFANGDPSLDRDDVVPWGTAPAPHQFQGGDLYGVADRLDYLERLGVDALYLNPIFTSPSNHKYDTVDYFAVDPAFGGDDALHRLVERAHARGIRVILDASFNHAHPRFFAFADVLARGQRSPYADWFVIEEWPIRIRVRPHMAPKWVRQRLPYWEEETGIPVIEVEGEGPAVDPTYEAWYGVATMPRLALDHSEARRYVLGVARHWLAEFDVDGWRMDVARYVDPGFWPEFRAACRAVKPDAYLLAEVVGDASPWLRGDAFDATMNYTFRSIALGFLARDEMDGAEFLDHCARLYGRHPLAVTLANHNLIGSHDTARFRTMAGGELWRTELATVFQMTFPGAPGIYYGDEVGLEGGTDPGCRGAMPWDEVDRRPGLIGTIATLAALRRRTAALRTGEWAPLAASRDAVAFERWQGGSRFLVAINRGRRPAHLAVTGAGETVWGDGSHSHDVVQVGARSAVIVKRRPAGRA
jgi:glycosidase